MARIPKLLTYFLGAIVAFTLMYISSNQKAVDKLMIQSLRQHELNSLIPSLQSPTRADEEDLSVPPSDGEEEEVQNEGREVKVTLPTQSADWMEPHETKANMVIFVMSGRNHFERRAVIRETWAKGHDNVFFLTGEPCRIPPHQRATDLTCASSSSSSPHDSDKEFMRQLETEQTLLTKEQEKHQDLLLVPKPESYSMLPFKLKEAYVFVMKHTTAKWIVKADDDMFVQVRQLEQHLNEYSSTEPAVLGHIMFKAPVHRDGKWKETNYAPRRYPNFPLGSWGHVVTRPVAEYIAKHKESLVEYQGEDTSLGIWLDESSLETKWIDASHHLTNKGRCSPRYLIVGHDISPEVMRVCQSRLGGTAVAPKSIGAPDPTEWMPPKITNATTIVMVMTARGHFEKRTSIRKTWGTDHDNVYFVVGEPCRVPKHKRQHTLTCEERTQELPFTRPPGKDEEDEKAHAEEIEHVQKRLLKEQMQYRDMIYTPNPESYRGLVHKLKEAYSWAITNTKANWIVKADDDTFVRVDSVTKLLEKYSPSNPTVVGRIIYNAPVHKTGKWADMEYKQSRYPPWAQGSCGHAVSRPVAEFVHINKDSLYEYQGEDTTLAIWLDESEIKNNVIWQSSRAFVNEGDCHNPDFVVIGHEISPSKMRQCYKQQDEVDVSLLGR